MTKSICNCNSLDDEKNNIKLKMNDSLEISIWSLEERIWEIECDMYSMKPDSNKFINKKVEINGKEMLVICESSGVNVSDVFLISRKAQMGYYKNRKRYRRYELSYFLFSGDE